MSGSFHKDCSFRVKCKYAVESKLKYCVCSLVLEERCFNRVYLKFTLQ